MDVFVGCSELFKPVLIHYDSSMNFKWSKIFDWTPITLWGTAFRFLYYDKPNL
jgi:hypothetical protein